MSERTAFLGRFIGIYFVLIALPMAANEAAMLRIVTALVHDAPVLYVFGLVLVAAGLAIVLGHNVWSGGALPVVVTVVGWLTLLKGLAFLFLPPPAAVGIVVWGEAYRQYYYLDVAVLFILGVALMYGGFRTSRAGDRP